MSRSGFPAGASLAFFMASSNFLARMSSLLYSWFQESRNLSSRLRCCSFKMPAASVRSTFGPVLGGGSWESTAPKTASTTSFVWQHGQVTFRFSTFCLAMEGILRLFDGRLEVATKRRTKPEKMLADNSASLSDDLLLRRIISALCLCGIFYPCTGRLAGD